jgi:hypothetical protein
MRAEGKLTLYFCPVQPVKDTLEVFDGDTLVFSQPLNLKPLETWTGSVPKPVGPENLRVRIGGTRFDYSGNAAARALSRPLDSPVDYDELTKLGSMMGSGGMIVMDDCNIEQTAASLMTSTFGNAGQRCLAAANVVVVGKGDTVEDAWQDALDYLSQRDVPDESMYEVEED